MLRVVRIHLSLSTKLLLGHVRIVEIELISWRRLLLAILGECRIALNRSLTTSSSLCTFSLVLQYFVHSLDKVSCLRNCWTSVALKHFACGASHSALGILLRLLGDLRVLGTSAYLLMRNCFKLPSFGLSPGWNRLRHLMLKVRSSCLLQLLVPHRILT